jgi:hypothetical protein
MMGIGAPIARLAEHGEAQQHEDGGPANALFVRHRQQPGKERGGSQHDPIAGQGD